MMLELKLIGFIGLFITLLSASVVEGPQDGEKLPVIIMFRGRYEMDPDLVRRVGGEVRTVYRFQPAVAALLPISAMEGLNRSPAVEYMVHDLEIELVGDAVPWGVERIGAVAAHLGGDRGTGINVAILDSGIDTDHPDLSYVYGYDFGEDDSDPEDFDGHGTHVAGTVAALRNGIGVLGVAPEANLYILKISTDGGSIYYSDAVQAFEYCIGTYTDEVEGNEIQVISMSWGSKKTSGDPGIESWIDQAYGLGILLIGAAGNEGKVGVGGDKVIYPARYPNVTAVGATGQDDARPTWSSTGPAVELAAPGVSILSTYLAGGYGTMGGTSMACPHVSGTAALILGSVIDPNYDIDADGVWDNDEVRKKLQDTAQDLGDPGRDVQYGYGLVDADRALGVEWFRGGHITPWPYPYNSTEGNQVITDLVDLNSNYVSVSAYLYQDSSTSSEVELDTGQDLGLNQVIGEIHGAGLKAVLTVFIWVRDGTWRGEINPADKPAWFSSYRAGVNHYAELTETEGVELLIIGSELENLKGYGADWLATIAGVRTKYQGSISYNQNWWYSDSKYDAVLDCAWFTELDYIGISGFFELTTENDPTLDELIAAWRSDAHGRDPVADLANLAYVFEVPIMFTEVGYRSMDGANMEPWNWTAQGIYDGDEQADCYRALFLVFHSRPWFRGTLFWAWSTDPTEGGSPDTGYVVREKPAETVLSGWYAKIGLEYP